MTDKKKVTRKKVVRMKVNRVWSEEDEQRRLNYPEYHLLVMHRSGEIVYQTSFMESEEISNNIDELRATGFSLEQKIIEAMEQDEDKRRPKALRRDPKPLPEIE